jgi:hypothetical protein
MVKKSSKERKKWSPAWKYFEKINEQTASCKICGHVDECSSNTSNLYHHLKTKHPEKYLALLKPDTNLSTPPSNQRTLHHPIPLIESSSKCKNF